MNRLPVIIAQGGISCAGRTSGFNAYKRLVYPALPAREKQNTLAALARLCGLDHVPGPGTREEEQLLGRTLIRRISLFDPQNVPCYRAAASAISPDAPRLMLPGFYSTGVSAGGQLPGGFAPEKAYRARAHPRGIAMTVYGAGDATGSCGAGWEALKARVAPDKIAVYAGSSMSQMDRHSNGGLLQARLRGRKVTARQLALGFAEMPADFINSYVTGTTGSTGTMTGACATFLYNLKLAAEDIRSGRARLVIVGNSEAPLTPEIMDGYATMKALANDAALQKLDGLTGDTAPDFTRACRPFAPNAGFTLGESAQFFVLTDDELAMETGAEILGAVGGVFVNADGYKHSITAPGAGNHITFARAVALGEQLCGPLQPDNSFVQAHGTGTPQNRVTESHILSSTAEAFGLEQWPVCAIKCHTGHSIATAGGDQLMATLGVWRHGILPGITTIREIADDVSTGRLDILTAHRETDPGRARTAFINAKGFGGNNATATVIAPRAVQNMLQYRYGRQAVVQWQKKREAAIRCAADYEQQCNDGTYRTPYRDREEVIAADDITLTRESVTLKGQAVPLREEHPYPGYFPAHIRTRKKEPGKK